MNNKATYELTITDKLQQLPLPNLEDAIWARVKTQLDNDLPTDDSDGSGPDTPPGKGWFWGSALALFIAALVAVFTLRKSTADTTSSPSPETNQQQTPLHQSGNDPLPTVGPTIGNRSVEAQPPPVAGDRTSVPFSSAIDSVLASPVISLPARDSTPPTTLVLPLTTIKDSVKPKPGKRGVQGLTDDDYRIVPATKDSL